MPDLITFVLYNSNFKFIFISEVYFFEGECQYQVIISTRQL